MDSRVDTATAASRAATRAPRHSTSRQQGRSRVLVTTPSWQSAIASLQSLGRAGHEVHLLGAHADAAIAQSRYCAGIWPSPPEAETAAYAANLLALLRQEQFDLLVPISDDAVAAIELVRPELEALVHVALPAPEQLAIGADKARTMQFAAQHGVPIPDSFFPRDLREARQLAAGIDYPCVAKLPRSTGNLGVEVVHTPEALVEFFTLRGTPSNWPFVQRFVAGDLYDVTAVCDQGEVAALFAFRSPIKYHLGGTPPYAYSLWDESLVDTATRFLRAIRWHGAVDLDFLLAPDGGYRLLELNPRLSGTTNFAFKLGVDLPRAYHDVALGRRRGNYGTGGYASGVLFRTLVPAELWWWNRGRRQRTAEVLAKALVPRARTNLYWSDPPLLRAQLRDIARLLRRQPLS